MPARLLIVAATLAVGTIAVAEEDPDVMIARGHFRRGEARFAAGDYAAALHEFQEARAVKPLPQFIYNIGICQERLGELGDALISYRAFASVIVDAVELAEVRARIARLEARSRALPHRPAGSQPSLVPAVVLGVSAAALGIVAAGVLGSVAGDYNDLDSDWSRAPSPSLVARAGDLETRATVGYLFLAAAVAVAAVDAVVLIVTLRGRGDARPRALASIGRSPPPPIGAAW